MLKTQMEPLMPLRLSFALTACLALLSLNHCVPAAPKLECSQCPCAEKLGYVCIDALCIKEENLSLYSTICAGVLAERSKAEVTKAEPNPKSDAPTPEIPIDDSDKTKRFVEFPDAGSESHQEATNEAFDAGETDLDTQELFQEADPQEANMGEKTQAEPPQEEGYPEQPSESTDAGTGPESPPGEKMTPPERERPQEGPPGELPPEQTPTKTWTKTFGSTGYDGGYNVTIDGQGNIYLLASIEGAVRFGGTTLSPQGNEDIAVVKLDANGNFIWAQAFGGTGNDTGWWIQSDPTGNVFVIGHFSNTVGFGATTLTSKGGRDIFVVKLDTNGKVVWAKSFGGTQGDYGYGIAIGAIGEIYIIGRAGPIQVGTTTLTPKGNSDILVAKLDKNGKAIWAKMLGGPQNDYGYGISLDKNGQIYITGTFEGNISPGTLPSLTSNGDLDIIVAKLDPTGKFIWAKNIGGSGEDYSYTLHVDPQNAIYLVGDFNNSMRLGNTTLTSQGGQDIFLTKLDASGTFSWSSSLGGTGDEYSYAIAVDPNNGTTYLAGSFEGSMNIGGLTFQAKGQWDALLVEFRNTGRVSRVIAAGGTMEENAYVPALDKNNGLILVGDFEGNTTLFDGKNYTSQGDFDGFITRFPR